MRNDVDDRRMVLADASVLITLAKIDLVDALLALEGQIVVPVPVKNEVKSGPARRALDSAEEDDRLLTMDVIVKLGKAADHLGQELSEDDLSGYGHLKIGGDIGLLALALQQKESESKFDSAVVVTDDKPLRKTCKALGIPISGSIGVLIAAVERGDLDPDAAKDALVAMDEVGARLSARLLRKAERLVDEAAEEREE